MRFLFLLCLVCSATLYAQPNHPLHLGKAPSITAIPDSFRKESAVIVLERRQIEYVTEGSEIVVYRTVQRRVQLLDDKGVASFNTVTIPIGPDREIVSVEARTILPGGAVIDVKKEDIKRTKSEEGVDQYLFALKGVERGAEIEYLYTEQRGMSVFGQEGYQFGIPVLEARFRLIAPDRLVFETKGYHGFPTTTDSVSDEVRYQTAVRYNLPGVEDEPYSNPSAYLARIGYKLGRIRGKTEHNRLFTWEELARQMAPVYYKYSDKERSALRKYLASIDVREDDEDVRKIRVIENDLKKNIAMSDDLADDEDTRNITDILKKKVTTEKGFARLLVASFTEAGVPIEIGLTSNRSEREFDEEFENWLVTDEYIAYLPRQRAFMAPTAVNFRYPFTPYVLTGHKGVFVKPPSAERSRSAAVLRAITSMPADSNMHTTTATITFAGEDLTPRVELVNAFKGYNATGFREVFVFSPKDKEKELVKDIVGIAATEDDIDSFRVEGAAFSGYSTGKPLTLSATIQARALMERAGAKYLFKVGDVIGKQVEMYNDEKRSLPIDMEYSHSLVRVLRITPPEGYKISNPAAAKVQVLPLGEGDNAPLGFVSDYTMEGRTMVVRIREFYNQTRFPTSDYQAFRKVINAAADWNKVVLVMQKG